MEEMIETHVGDCRDVLPTLPAGSVHCVVTSPPYWGLRDYGTVSWEGGDDPECDHRSMPASETPFRSVCGRCAARRIDNQIGLEETPELYLETMVGVFREVWRVLRDDGTVWLNMGDGYARQGGAHGGRNDNQLGVGAKKVHAQGGADQKARTAPAGLKPKDLIGMPWRLALALQADGWYLRSDIVWAKPSPLPESCMDRPTKSHEYVFLLTKQPTYFYDAEAIREPVTGTARARGGGRAPKSAEPGSGIKANSSFLAAIAGLVTSRNKRSVWTIPSYPYRDAHFATFPPDLVKPCILAGTSARGVCPECGAPWVGEVEDPEGRLGKSYNDGAPHCKTTGWRPGCGCGDLGPFEPISATVLDLFSGSGTVGQVALELCRRAVLIELNPDYVKLSDKRTTTTPGLPGLA